MEIHCVVFLLFGVFSSTTGSTVKPKAEINLQEAVFYLTQRTLEVEIKVAGLESMLRHVLQVNDELRVTIRDAETKSQQEKNQFLVKMGEMETESTNRRNDVSVKLQELVKRVTEVETLCGQSTSSVADDLRKAENRFTKIDNHLLRELLQLKPMLKEAVENVHNVRAELTSAMEKERLKTHSLQVQMIELNSELHSVDLIRKNMSLLTDNLRSQLNESLTFGLENIQTNLTRNMRIFENSSLKFSKDYANFSYVSKLDEHLKNLEKSSKNELETLQYELSPRLEKLEARSDVWDDIPEMKKTLINHSSQLDRLWNVGSLGTCDDEPPSILEGKTLKFDRNPRSIVQYECDQDFVMTRNSTVHCKYGKWEGHPSTCSFFDATFTLVVERSWNIACYSERYSQHITFSRVVDTGSQQLLPLGAPTGRQGTMISLSGRGNERNGAYECRFQVDNRGSGTVVPIHHHGFFGFYNRSVVANIGDTVELIVFAILGDRSKLSKLRWRHNGVPVPSWNRQTTVNIPGVQTTDAGIYEWYMEGSRNETQSLLRLIVRKCGKNRYGGNCDQECPTCYNGGICHDLLGVCICPVGFRGKNCELACGENHVSGDCAMLCGTPDCRFYVFCKPDPYGCSCFPGFKGINCNFPCEPGWYGADCKQPCHCANGPESCNKTTGACTGRCSSGWRGQSCQIEVGDDH